MKTYSGQKRLKKQKFPLKELMYQDKQEMKIIKLFLDISETKKPGKNLNELPLTIVDSSLCYQWIADSFQYRIY